MKNSRKTWLVTGASKGLGLTLVKKLLAGGYNVIATSRKSAELEQAVSPATENFLPLQMDIVNEANVKEGVAIALTKFGKIDVLVNNAGYGIVGACEELSDAESRANFDVNVFGSLNLIRHVAPHLRANQNGHIFNISSIGGFNGGFAGFGIYCATKFAVHGFTESLSHELQEFNVKATLVLPGYFRTNFLESDSLVIPKNPLDDYKSVRDMQILHQQQINNNQPGDPEKAAEVLIEVAHQEDPALHLFLGADAYQYANQKLDLVKADMKGFEALATSTGF